MLVSSLFLTTRWQFAIIRFDLGLIQKVSASSPVTTKSEYVTFYNLFCLYSDNN
jgi:hypothetical protein